MSDRTEQSPASSLARRNLVGLGRTEIAAEMAAFGAEKFRAGQLWHWIYHRGVTDFATMTNLAKPFRERLAEHYELRRPAVAQARISIDGTRKWLLRFDDGQEAETVHIPESDRGTLCVSSQVGCTLTCRFCHTGTQRLVRNLSAAEIVGQVMVARDALGEWPSPKEDRHLTNIVLMGMGEPLYNYENVAAAMKIVMDPEGLAISRRKITLSTSGVVPMIARVGAELGVNLAVSLHAVTDELRNQLVPLNRKYPIAELLEACRNYPGVEQCAAHHVRIRDAERGQRQPGRGARTGAAAAGHPGQGQSDPVQSLARRAVRMLDRRGDRGVFRDRVQRRLFGAGAHAARARHSGGLRPAQIGERAGASGRDSSVLRRPHRIRPSELTILRCVVWCGSPGIAAAGYLAVVAGLYLYQRQLLYHPDRARPLSRRAGRARGPRGRACRPRTGCHCSHGICRPAGERPVIVYFHGNGGHIGYRADRIERFAREGYGVLMLEYRGYGGNPGVPSEAGLFEDAAAALRFVEAQGVPGHRLVLYGELLGTGSRCGRRQRIRSARSCSNRRTRASPPRRSIIIRSSRPRGWCRIAMTRCRASGRFERRS